MSSWEGISIIAHYTAQIWVRDCLPWAFHFDTPLGRALHAGTSPLFSLAAQMGVTSPPDFCIQRHRIIDALLQARPPAQIVELAGGLSPRCLAFSQKWRIRCIDVDLPHMVSAKAAMVGDSAPQDYCQVSMDLVECNDYVAGLGTALLPRGPAAVVTEGILSYLPLELQQQVFSRIAALLRACGGGTYLTDVHHEEAVDQLGLLGAAFRFCLHTFTNTRQVALIADEDQGRQMLRQAGFSRVTIHHPADWQQALDIPIRDRSAGLTVYQAEL